MALWTKQWYLIISGYFPKHNPSLTHVPFPSPSSMPCISGMLPVTVPVSLCSFSPPHLPLDINKASGLSFPSRSKSGEVGKGCVILTKISSCEKTGRPAVWGLCDLGQVVHLTEPQSGHPQNGTDYTCPSRSRPGVVVKTEWGHGYGMTCSTKLGARSWWVGTTPYSSAP